RGVLEMARVDGTGLDEGLDLDRVMAFRGGRGDVLLLEHHVAALVVLVGLDDVLPRHFLAGLGGDALVADARVVARIEHADGDVGLALAGQQRDGDVGQPAPPRAGPDGTGHGRVLNPRRGRRRTCGRFGTAAPPASRHGRLRGPAPRTTTTCRAPRPIHRPCAVPRRSSWSPGTARWLPRRRSAHARGLRRAGWYGAVEVGRSSAAPLRTAITAAPPWPRRER